MAGYDLHRDYFQRNLSVDYSSAQMSQQTMGSSGFAGSNSMSEYTSAAQPAFYSSIDKSYSQNYQMGSSDQPSFGYEYSAHLQNYGTDAQQQAYNQAALDAYNTANNTQDASSSASFYSQYQQQQLLTNDQGAGSNCYTAPGNQQQLFGIDFSDEQQRKQLEEFQQQFQQAFEQQLAQQIQLQLQQQSLAQAGNLGASVVDGVAVFFGDDSVGKRRDQDGGMLFGVDQPGKKWGGGSDVAGGGLKRVVGDYERMWSGESFGRSPPSNVSTSRSAVVGRDGQMKNTKFYCSTCDVSYANSLAFTSHLGSSDHKLQREIELKKPKPPTVRPPQHPIQTPQSTPSATLPSSSSGPRKEITCQLCNITCPGADVYAQHIKSEEHQRILRSKNENKRTVFDTNPAMPLPQEFGVDHGRNRDFEPNQPVGVEFIEEFRNRFGEIVRVVCNLCRCNIPNAEMRRRHVRNQRHKSLYEERMANEGPLFGQDPVGSNNNFGAQWVEPFMGNFLSALRGPSRPFDMGSDFGQQVPSRGNYRGPRPPPTFGADHPKTFGVDVSSRRIQDLEPRKFGDDVKREEETDEDKCLKEKHSAIYPTGDDFKAVQKITGDCDRWLKTMMITLLDSQEEMTPIQRLQHRVIKEVTRIGSLAKGLLLHSCLISDLLVLTRDWPTKQLVRTILKEIEVLVEKNGKENEYKINLSEEENSIIVWRCAQPEITCNIHVTSRAVENANTDTMTDDHLDLNTCTRLLSSLEQTRWFQKMAIPLPSCLLVVRVFKSLLREVKGWSSLTNESMEYLVEKIIRGEDGSKNSGVIFKKVVEKLASGFLLVATDGNVAGAGSTEEDSGSSQCNTNDDVAKQSEESSGKTEDQELLGRFNYLAKEQREEVTKTAKIFVKMVSLGRLRKVLNLEEEEEDGKLEIDESAVEEEIDVNVCGSEESLNSSQTEKRKCDGAGEIEQKRFKIE